MAFCQIVLSRVGPFFLHPNPLNSSLYTIETLVCCTHRPSNHSINVSVKVDYIKAPTRDADKWWKPAVDKHIKDFGKVDELPM